MGRSWEKLFNWPMTVLELDRSLPFSLEQKSVTTFLVTLQKFSFSKYVAYANPSIETAFYRRVNFQNPVMKWPFMFCLKISVTLVTHVTCHICLKLQHWMLVKPSIIHKDCAIISSSPSWIIFPRKNTFISPGIFDKIPIK